LETVDAIKKIVDANNAIIKTADLSALNIYYHSIQKLLQKGMLRKIKHGYYCLAEHADGMSEAALVAQLFPDGVLCMYSALFYYGYSNHTPLAWDLAVDKDTSKARFDLDYPYVKPYYLEPSQLSFGITEADYGDCEMAIFDRDRLICECLQYENKMDREIFNSAIQNYVKDSKKCIPNLLEYAKLRRVKEKVRQRVGVWL
jgi:predicted transcriptional regulator of viral defense system